MDFNNLKAKMNKQFIAKQKNQIYSTKMTKCIAITLDGRGGYKDYEYYPWKINLIMDR